MKKEESHEDDMVDTMERNFKKIKLDYSYVDFPLLLSDLILLIFALSSSKPKYVFCLPKLDFLLAARVQSWLDVFLAMI